MDSIDTVNDPILEPAASDEEVTLSHVRVVRDSTFLRAAADRIVVMPLGKDIDLCFIQSGPLIDRIEDHGDSERLIFDPVLTEVARVRVTFPAAINFAMSVLNDGIATNKLKGDALLRQVQEWVDNAPVESDKEIVTDGE